jgi:class 3 adenylate cyclase
MMSILNTAARDWRASVDEGDPGQRSGQTDIEPRLIPWVETLVESRWAALVLDSDNRLIWVSDELQAFIGERDPEKLGVGRHIAAAFLTDSWLRSITPESSLDLFHDVIPFFLDGVPGGPAAFAETVAPSFRALFAGASARPQPDIFTGRFDYREDDLAPYEVRFLCGRMRDDSGSPIGSFVITYMGLRPTLVSLLARGDETMYERMADLVEPGRHSAAILFADLQDSGDLSRRLPTPRYFDLIRTLSSRFDHSVATNHGVVGKHAGDGMTAFFLADGDARPAQATCNALRTAREVLHWAAELTESLSEGIPSGIRVNVALHWGPNLYMGQIVPGGRLDVTALGDEVNECARMQESTRDGAVSVSKAFAELLQPDDAAALGIDLAAVLYRPLATIPGVSEKAVRDAGTLAVAQWR